MDGMSGRQVLGMQREALEAAFGKEEGGRLDSQIILSRKVLFSLVQVKNQSFGPKQNTRFTANHHPPPTENFLQSSRHFKRLKLNRLP